MEISRTFHQGTFTSSIARGLGWFSIGLGVVELLAPGRLARLIGTGRNDALVRAYGARARNGGRTGRDGHRSRCGLLSS